MHATLCDFVHDIALNAIQARSPKTEVSLAEEGDDFSASVVDTGDGMTDEQLHQAQDPFVTAPGKHPGRSVGLGLSFLHQLVGQTLGSLDVRSEVGKGTSVSFSVSMAHVDCPPLGDVAGLAFHLMCYPGDYELLFSRKRQSREYTVRRGELREALGDVESVDSLALLRAFLDGEESSLTAVEV